MRFSIFFALFVVLLTGCATEQGCTDPNAVNFDQEAIEDDGSCEYGQGAGDGCSSVEMDGYSYGVVEIGNQCWFSENLRTTVFADGSLIPGYLPAADWENTMEAAFATYGAGSSPCNEEPCDEVIALAEFGRLYNFAAAIDSRNICPTGWAVSTRADWEQLMDYLEANGNESVSGDVLKSSSGWIQDGNGADLYGFDGRGAGWRGAASGSFNSARWVTYFHTGEVQGDSTLRPRLYATDDLLKMDWGAVGNGNLGISVRCVKD